MKKAQAGWMMQRLWSTMVAVLAVSPASLAALAASAAGGPRWVLRTIDQPHLVGELLALSPDEGIAIRTDKGDQVVVRLADLIEARTEVPSTRDNTGPAESSPMGWPRTFTSRQGGRLIGTLVAAGDGKMVVSHPWLGSLPVLRDRLVWIGSPGGETWRARVLEVCGEQAAVSPADANDRIELSNGDVISGRIVAFGLDRIAADVQDREVAVTWDRVAKITFAPAPAGAKDAEDHDRGESALSSQTADGASAAVAVVLDLADGSRLIAGDIRYQGQGASFRCRTDGRRPASGFDVPANRVKRIAVRGGRWQWLSDRCPAEIVTEPMFTLTWPPVADANVLGGLLSINGRRYERGIGLHANCRLVYGLGGAYERFVSGFGLDDDSGGWADMDVRVIVDGRTRFSARHVRRGEQHDPVDVDLTGAQRLELIVTAGAGGDVQDRFNWVDAGLVRVATSPATQPKRLAPGPH